MDDKDGDRYLIRISEAELVKLIKTVGFIDCTFGPGGIALIWKKRTPMPEAVRRLGLMRGVINENCDGTGI